MQPEIGASCKGRMYIKFMFTLWTERDESLHAVKDVLIMKVLIALSMNCFLFLESIQSWVIV